MSGASDSADGKQARLHSAYARLPRAAPSSFRTMYIVAIAWLYVVMLMALTEESVIAGIMTVLLYGLAPLALFLWLVGTPQRRRNRRSAVDPDQ